MIHNFYTDGAATMRKDENGNYIREAGGCAFALFNEKDELVYQHSGHADKTTNQRMELMAIFDALSYYIDKKLHSGDIVNIYSDSAYCINIFTQWVEGWRNNGWTRKGNKPIENLDIIKEIYTRIVNLKNHFVTVNFIKVAGHSNDEHNNLVDALAVAAKAGNTRGLRRYVGVIDDAIEKSEYQEFVEAFLNRPIE